MRLLVLFEGSFENKGIITGLEKNLKEHGWTNTMFNKAYEQAHELTKKQNKQQDSKGGLKPMFGQSVQSLGLTKTASDYYKEILQNNWDKIDNDKLSNDKGDEITDADIEGHIPAEHTTDIVSEPKTKSVKDESVIDALQLLAKNLGPLGKDKTLVIAARFGIDRELIEGAGLGSLPPNYNDEDVWNLLSISKDKRTGKPIKFVDSTWQPFYIDAVDSLQDLPNDVREHIVEMLTSDDPKETTYPVKNDNSMMDDPTINKNIKKVYEAKLIKDLVIESNDSINIIEAGTIILITK
jgi:hypothetical protein